MGGGSLLLVTLLDPILLVMVAPLGRLDRGHTYCKRFNDIYGIICSFRKKKGLVELRKNKTKQNKNKQQQSGLSFFFLLLLFFSYLQVLAPLFRRCPEVTAHNG